MAFKTSDGKSKNSKFRAGRYDKEKGARAQADAMGQGQGERQATKNQGSETDSEQSRQPSRKPAPKGDPESGQQSDPGYRELHVLHDDNQGHHSVSVVHHDGRQEHIEHASRGDAHEHAQGIIKDHGGDNEGNYPQENETGVDSDWPDGDDFDVDQLDQPAETSPKSGRR